MIELKGVTKVYEMGESPVIALNDVNLNVEEGDFLAVMGPSGSGKSTLLYVIGGLLTPTKGDVTVNGSPIYNLTQKKRAEFRRESVGFIFQEFELLPYLTAIENVMLPLYLSGIPSTEQENAAREALGKMGLAKRAQHKPCELSGGEQQRVAIARGIVSKPKLLLADEPTGNLDQKTGTEIVQLLRGLNEKEGFTLILVTHDQAIARGANRLVEMVDGYLSSKGGEMQ